VPAEPYDAGKPPSTNTKNKWLTKRYAITSRKNDVKNASRQNSLKVSLVMIVKPEVEQYGARSPRYDR